MSVLVLGTVALDSLRTPSGVRHNLLGGSAAHFAMSARLFTDVHLVAIIGRDFPEKYIRFLQKQGVELSSVEVSAGKSFRWNGEYKKDDMNAALTLATELGVLVGYQPRLAPPQCGIAHIFLANIDPDIQMGLLKSIRAPKLVGLDSMNLWITHKCRPLKALMKKVDLFVANDGEARALTGESNLVQAARGLRKMGPKLIVVKKGEHGVLFYCDDFMFSFPAYPVEKVVDPTGAGDTFAGGLMGYLCRAGKVNEKVLRQAVLYATTAASFNVEGFGMAKTAALTMPAMKKRMETLVRFIRPGV